jgi:RNA polymerase sigma factor (sigma-70 family)
MKNISDGIILKAAQGDMSSFEEIYGETSGFVYAVSYRVTYSREDAQEVTQDVFIKVYDNLRRFKVGTSFKSWIYRIAINTAINYYNKKKKLKVREGGDFELASLTHGKESEAQRNMDVQESQVRIAELLSKLNHDQRICMILREIEGLSYEEIAKALKVKINTVRTRLKRGRETLLRFIKMEGYHEV